MELGLVLPDSAYGVDTEGMLELAGKADRNGFSSLWKQESSGDNGLMALSAITQATEEIQLGSGIANVYSRTPTLLGMSAATLDNFSDGRAVLGLGVSSEVIVEKWHGLEYERPLRRLRESIDVIRSTFEGGTVDYQGECFELGPYSVGFETLQSPVPIYVAGMRSTARRLTGEFGDGWIPGFVPLSELESQIKDIRDSADQAGRDPEAVTAAPWVATAVHSDPAVAEQRVRDFLAQEMAMGYNNLVREYGFGDEGDEAFRLWRDGDREAAAAALSDEMIDEFAIYGTPEDCYEKLTRFSDAGVDTTVLAPSFTMTFDEYVALTEDLNPDRL